MEETTTVRNRIRNWKNDNPAKVATAVKLNQAAAAVVLAGVAIRVTEAALNRKLNIDNTEE